MLYYIGRCNVSGDLWRYVSLYTGSSMLASCHGGAVCRVAVAGAALVVIVVEVVVIVTEVVAVVVAIAVVVQYK